MLRFHFLSIAAFINVSCSDMIKQKAKERSENKFEELEVLERTPDEMEKYLNKTMTPQLDEDLLVPSENLTKSPTESSNIHSHSNILLSPEPSPSPPPPSSTINPLQSSSISSSTPPRPLPFLPEFHLLSSLPDLPISFVFLSFFPLSFFLSFSTFLPFLSRSPLSPSPSSPSPFLFLSDFLPFPSLLLILPGESLFFYFPAAPSPPFSLSPFLPFPFPRPP